MASVKRRNPQLAIERRRAGLSQGELAEDMHTLANRLSLAIRPGVDTNYVSRWERGANLPEPEHRILICLRLRLPARQLGFPGDFDPAQHPAAGQVQAIIDGIDRRRGRSRSAPVARPSLIADATSAGEAFAPGAGIVVARRTGVVLPDDGSWPGGRSILTELAEVERREFLTLIAAIAADAVVNPPVGSALDAVAEAAEADPVRQVVRHYRQLDGRVPSRNLLRPTLSHLHLTAQLASEARTPWAKRQLTSTLSEAASFAAWLHLDLGNDVAARENYQLAVRLATMSNDRLLWVYQLGSLAAFAADRGDPAEAVGLYQHLAPLLPASAPATARAWLASLEALTFAPAGQEHRSLTALDACESIIDEGDPELSWPWLSSYDGSKLVAVRARCNLTLERFPAAVELFQTALAREVMPTRRRGELLIGLATALVHLNQIQQACMTLTTAIDLAVAAKSPMLIARIRGVRQQLNPWADAREVAEFDERLHITWI